MSETHHKLTVEEREKASREVVQSYIATTAMYDFNVYEKRVLYNLVKLAQSQIEGVKLADNLYKIEHGLEDFLRIELPMADFLTDSEDKNHSRVKTALKSLHQKTFYYKDDEVWECMSIIANPQIKQHSSRVSFIVIEVRDVDLLSVLVFLLICYEPVATVSVNRLAPLSVLLDEQVDIYEYGHLTTLAGLSPCPHDLGVPSESCRTEHLREFLDPPHRVDVVLAFEPSGLDFLLGLLGYVSYALIYREVVVLLDLLTVLHICLDYSD